MELFPESDKAVAEILTKLIQVVENNSDQLPDIANQMLAYGWIYAWVWVVMALPLIPLTAILIKWGRKEYGEGVLYFFTFWLIILAMALVTRGAQDIIKITYAPKLYVLDKIEEKIRPSCNN